MHQGADVVLTVLDTATIYEARETIYRYDLTGENVVQGVGLNGVIEQLQQLTEPQWPGVFIRLVPDTSSGEKCLEAVEILARQLRVSDVKVDVQEPEPSWGVGTEHFPALDKEQPPTFNENQVAENEFEPIRPPGQTAQARHGNAVEGRQNWILGKLRSFPLLVIAAVIAVGAGVWLLWAGPEDPPVSTDSQSDDTEEKSIGTSTSQAPDDEVEDQPTDPQEEEFSRIEAGGLAVVLPEGFTVTEEDGVLTATGNDPELRILLAADPMYSVPATALFAELRKEIDQDETLSQPRESFGRFSYTELPGDESQVTWTTWVENDHQVSLGCHTKVEPTVVQKAACRMAEESLRKLEN